MRKIVLLIDPFYNGGYVPPNWSLGIIEAELLQDGIEVIIADFIDPNCETYNYDYLQKKESEYIEKILDKIITNKIEIIYISSSYGIPLKPLPVFPRIIKIAREIKLINKRVKIIVGGANMTYAKRILNISLEKLPAKKYIDFFVIGDEEKSLLLIKRFLKMEISIRRHSDYYPQVVWKNWDFAKYPSYLSLFTAKGCPNLCKFCFEPKAFDEKYVKYNIISIINNIKSLVAVKGINKFFMEDSTFLANPECELFCDYILREEINIKWIAYARVNEVVNKCDLLSKMKKAGCSGLLIGIETPKKEILKKENKLITPNLSLRAVELLKANNINIQGCFILNFPEDSLQDIENTINFAYSFDLYSYRWHIFQPNFSQKVRNFLGNKIHPSDYLRTQLNVPDHCLPDIIKENPPIGLFDEHCLIRAIPYLEGNNPKLLNIGYQNKSFQETFGLIKEKLIKRQESFNEEKNYNLINR